jgi:hypothetical protein
LKGRRQVNTGHRLVAWVRVCMPQELDSLEQHNLIKMGWRCTCTGCGRLGHPLNKLMLLAILDRCSTADRLAKRGLQHPDRCPLCDQGNEDIQHLHASCVFAQEFWLSLLPNYGLQARSPTTEDRVFAEWWCKMVATTQVNTQRAQRADHSWSMDVVEILE